MPPPTLRTRSRSSRWPLRLAPALLAIASLAPPAEAIAPGDILVNDASSNRVIRIDPSGVAAPSVVSSGPLLSTPVGIGVRSDGFIFVTNIGNGAVLRIEPGAAIEQFPLGFVDSPRGLDFLPNGDVYVSAPFVDSILKLDGVTGTQSVFASGPNLQFAPGLLREPDGNLVVAESSAASEPRVLRIDATTGVQSVLSQGGLFQVLRDIAIDPVPAEAGSFLVTDSTARVVYRVDATLPYDPDDQEANQSVWVACSGFQNPRGIAVEAGGSVLVSDFGAKAVFRVDPVTKACTALASGGLLTGPWDVTVVGAVEPVVPDPFLVADAAPAHQVLRVDPVAGTGTPVPSDLPFVNPVAITRDLDGDLLVLESDRILRVTPGGVQSTVATFPVAVDLTGIVVDSQGEIRVTDAADAGTGGRLWRVVPGGGTPTIVTDVDPLTAPSGLVIDDAGMLVVAIRGRPAQGELPPIATGILRIHPNTGVTSIVSQDTDFGELAGVALDHNGDLLLADEGADTIWRYQKGFSPETALRPVSAGFSIEALRGIAVDSKRTVLVSNQGAASLLRVDPTTGAQSEIAASLAFAQIRGIALDANPSPASLDGDGDGVENDLDNCPAVANPAQLDTDDDDLGDACDNCAEHSNPDQFDANSDGFGNACDADYDESGTVGVLDFGLLKAQYGLSSSNPAFDPEFDADGNGSIGTLDFGVLKSMFGGPPGPSGLACAGTIPCPAP
jgi:streptogramin lyase